YRSVRRGPAALDRGEDGGAGVDRRQTRGAAGRGGEGTRLVVQQYAIGRQHQRDVGERKRQIGVRQIRKDVGDDDEIELSIESIDDRVERCRVDGIGDSCGQIDRL